MKSFLFSVALLMAASSIGQQIIAHAHNDYENEIPLIGALEAEFRSVEVDIYEDNGALKVSHLGFGLDGKPTLKELYLNPLADYLERNKVHDLWLLIDLKEGGIELLDILHAEIEQFAQIFSSRVSVDDRPVKILLSGSVPRDAILKNEKYEFFYLDGRIEHLAEDWDSELMPLISANFNKVVKWKGKGEMKRKDKQEIMDLVKLANAQGKRVRFWKTPDSEDSWKTLMELGVDVIGTDEVKGLSAFLESSSN